MSTFNHSYSMFDYRLLQERLSLQAIGHSLGVKLIETGHYICANSLSLIGSAVLLAAAILAHPPESDHLLNSPPSSDHIAASGVNQWVTPDYSLYSKISSYVLLHQPVYLGMAQPRDIFSLNHSTNQALSSQQNLSILQRANLDTLPAPVLTPSQKSIANWVSRRYDVGSSMSARIVSEAWKIATKNQIDPTLVLAVVAVESNFNPYAQSHMGAQGLMQVMTSVHRQRFSAFGGSHAAFDPMANLRVGVQILKEYIRIGGDVVTALQYYSGAAKLSHDRGYANKVLSIKSYLDAVARGQSIAVNAPVNSTPLPIRKNVNLPDLTNMVSNDDTSIDATLKKLANEQPSAPVTETTTPHDANTVAMPAETPVDAKSSPEGLSTTNVLESTEKLAHQLNVTS